VVSAMAGVTNALVRMAEAAVDHRLEDALRELAEVKLRHVLAAETLVSGNALPGVLADFEESIASLERLLNGIAAVGELSARSHDAVLAYGEMLSSVLVSAAFRTGGLNSVHLDSRRVIVTDDSYKAAQPIMEQTEERLRKAVNPAIREAQVPVMAGFIAATQEGVTSTLGRGGSDYTAAIVGAALSVEAIEIWTDVEGMLTTDPRLCSDAKRIQSISFDEAAELAYFGAKVLHPATLLPAVEKNIPVYVLNSGNVNSTGTCIRKEVPPSRSQFRAIAAKKGSTVINLRAPRMLFASGFLRSMFEVLEKHRCSVDLVSTSEVSVSLVVDPSHDVAGILPELKRMGDVEVESGKAIVCLVGNNIRGRVGIAAQVFQTLAESGVNIHMISQGASEINISVVVDEGDVPKAVNQLQRRFFPKSATTRSRKKTFVTQPKKKPQGDAAEVSLNAGGAQ